MPSSIACWSSRYGEIQAGAAVAAAIRSAGEGASTEALIRFGLKELAR